MVRWYPIMSEVVVSFCCSMTARQSGLVAVLYLTISFEHSDAGHHLNVNQLPIPYVIRMIMMHDLNHSINQLKKIQVNCTVQKKIDKIIWQISYFVTQPFFI